ncbi:MAG: RnfABCDGE type electron transport complex subunit B [Clostridia bacterium]|nr:RnfABCDGE type electron transport complex subunit B [Clostridia bacterium]
MNITNIILAVSVLGALGLIFGVVLSLASSFFATEEDERIDKIVELLPGANCGACGFAGCEAFAKAVTEGTARPGGCSVGGEKTAELIAEIMGTDADYVKQFAHLKCSASCAKAPHRYEFSGLDDCRAAARLGGGPKSCTYGCIGLGTCAKVCPLGAISLEDGLAVIDGEKCMACGVCVSTCPKNLIEIVPTTANYFVACASKDKGAQMKTLCSTGCIGCGICAKTCPHEAIEFENNLARIIPFKCQNCGLCAEKCPKKIIHMY